MLFDKLFKKKKVAEKPIENKDSVTQFADALGSFVMQMKELSDSDDSINVVIENSFNTTVENWSDDDIATGDIDFENIKEVDIACREMSYRIETEDEFDPVMTNFLTEQDGWQHYETKTVEYEVPNGYEYTFLIYYKNGSKETRVYHESSYFAERLISISESSSLQKNVTDSFTRLSSALRKMAEQENEEDETVVIEDVPLKDLSYLPIEDFVMLNIETTGSNNNYLTADFDEIISVSIFDENGTVLLDELCDTERKKTWDEAQKTHGISPEDVKGLPTFSDILKDVLKILSEHHCVIAHDMVYVLGFIKGYVNNKPDANELYHKANWRLDVDSKEIYEFYESRGR